MPAEENKLGMNYLQSCMAPHVGDQPTALVQDARAVDQAQVAIAKIIEDLRVRRPARGVSLAITKLEEAAFWLGHE